MTIERIAIGILVIWVIALQGQVSTVKTTADDAYSLSDDAYSIGREASNRVDDACTILRNGC